MKPHKDSLTVIKDHWTQMPVPVAKIAAEIGLGPVYEEMPEGISGAIRRKPDGKYEIVVNSLHGRARQRFTIAHEIGHYIYHRDLLGRGTGDNLAFRAEGTRYPNPYITAREEREANTVAANILMPTHHIKALKERGIDEPAEMAKMLGVSTPAMRIKLGLPPYPDLLG